MHKFTQYIVLISTGILTGAVCGFFGSVFSKSVGFVTDLRTAHAWILYLLPIGSLLSVLIYKLFKIKGVGTVAVFKAARTQKDLPHLLAPAIFLGTCISHLFGASAGREGAALQIGGGVANSISRVLKLDEKSRRVIIMCGMAAVFSAVFGTPLAAWFFVLEAIFTTLCFEAALPVLCSSFTAFLVATCLKVSPERFHTGKFPEFTFSVFYKVALITAVCVLVAFIFCKGLKIAEEYAEKIFKNEYLRIAVGGAVIVVLTLIIDNTDYNGGGINIIERTFEGDVKYEAFALKLIFTVICVAAGFKGGEIIPTLFIGATLGGALAVALSLPIGTGAAVGMAVLFCAATKCPVATILLCGEMFGFSCLPYIIPTVAVTIIAARYNGLYGTTDDIVKLTARKLNLAKLKK